MTGETGGAAQPEDPDELIEATVARGTVVWGDIVEKRDEAGRITREGVPRTESGPGETVRLSRAEVEVLRDRGFLVAHGGVYAPTRGNGPLLRDDPEASLITVRQSPLP